MNLKKHYFCRNRCKFCFMQYDLKIFALRLYLNIKKRDEFLFMG